MSQIPKFQKLLKINGFKIILFVVGLALLYSLSKSLFTDTSIYNDFLIGYAHSIALVLHFLFGDIQFDASLGHIIYQQHTLSTLNSLAVKFYAFAFVILFFRPRQVGKSLFVFAVSSVVFYLLAILRYTNDLFAPASLSSFFFSVIVGLRYLTLYFVIKYKIGLHAGIMKNFNKIDVKVEESFHFSFHHLLIIVALVPAVTGFFDWFLIAKWNYFVTALSHLILLISNGLLWLLGHPEAYIYNNYILLGNYWLYLGTNCLGVGLMVVFSSLIIAIRSPLINKSLFVVVGLIVLIVMNAVRIVGILLYISINKIPQQLIEDYHNQSNNLFYFVVFVIVLFYINKFQYLKLDFRRKNSFLV